MTDNEIIKALECCAYWESDKSCEECPANTYGFSCANKMAKHYLELINRQKAEIERLNKIRAKQANIIGEERGQKYELLNKIGKSKSEAIKEFAHFIIDRSRNGLIYASDIPDLVKEMAEGKNG